MAASEQVIKELAEEYGGTRSHRYNQAEGLAQNWRQLIPASQGGVCGGLSLIWLASQKAGLTSQVFGAHKYSEALFKYAEHAQQNGADNLVGAAGIDGVASVLSLNRAGARVMVNNNNVGRWAVNGASPLVFVTLARHAAAANVTKPRVSFFEPNYSVFSFPTTLKFFYFLGDYLTYAPQTAKSLAFYK